MLSDPRDSRDQVSALSALARLQNLSRGERSALVHYCKALMKDPSSSTRVLKEIAYLFDAQELGSSGLLIDLAAHESYSVRWAAEEALAGRGGWGDDLGRVWREARSPEALTRWAALLPYRPAREVRRRVLSI